VPPGCRWTFGNSSRRLPERRTWKGGEGSSLPRKHQGPASQGVPGFCKSATTEEVATHGYALTPRPYPGTEQGGEDDEPVEEKMKGLATKLHGQFGESGKLEHAIQSNLKRCGHGN